MYENIYLFVFMGIQTSLLIRIESCWSDSKSTFEHDVVFVERHWTPFIIVKDQSSHLLYLNICTKQQICENLNSMGSQNCEINNGRKNTLVTRSCVLSDAWFRDLKINFWGLSIKFKYFYFFLENFVTSEGAVSHNVLYYQQLSIACYQLSFYANNYF